MLFNLDEESINDGVMHVKGLAKNKVRQYFDDIKGLKRKIEAGVTEDQIKVQLRLMLSRATYDTGRAIEKRNKKEEENFMKFNKFIRTSIERVLNAKDQNIGQSVKEFATFFEAVFGHFYYEKEIEKKETGEDEE